MSITMPQPNLPPPTAALPQLPVSKLRSPSIAPEISRMSSASPTASKLALRTPSKVSKPPSLIHTNHTTSSPSIPTLRSTSAHHSKIPSDDPGDKEVRRSVSIANFPQPPKVQRRTGVESKYSSAAYHLLPGTAQTGKSDIPPSSQGSGSAETHTGGLRAKRLKTKTLTGTLGQTYAVGPSPTLLNGSGEGKAINGVQPGTRESNDLASLRSPPHSRSSSAQSSYSTSATTFEEGEEKRGREGRLAHAEDKSKRRESGKGGQGNVVVSVRVRPDTDGDKSSGKDWLVDGRQSLVAYKGREGGDYYYGKHSWLFTNVNVICSIICSRQCFRASRSKSQGL